MVVSCILVLGILGLGCEPAPAAPPVARYCQTATLVRYSARDTAETRRQLRVANARYRAACGG